MQAQTYHEGGGQGRGIKTCGCRYYLSNCRYQVGEFKTSCAKKEQSNYNLKQGRRDVIDLLL